MNLYRLESSDAKRNAQRNLSGRTHYVDDDTLRFHKSRIISTHITDNGLLFSLVEPVAMDIRNTQRGFRYVIFDVFGKVVSRVDIEHCWKSSKAARKAMWAELDSMDAKAVTLAAIDRQEAAHAREMAQLRANVAAIGQKVAA